jgi:hypothetical protein
MLAGRESRVRGGRACGGAFSCRETSRRVRWSTPPASPTSPQRRGASCDRRAHWAPAVELRRSWAVRIRPVHDSGAARQRHDPVAAPRLFALDARRELRRVTLHADLLSPLIDSGRGRLYIADQSGLLHVYGLRATHSPPGGLAPRRGRGFSGSSTFIARPTAAQRWPVTARCICRWGTTWRSSPPAASAGAYALMG